MGFTKLFSSLSHSSKYSDSNLPSTSSSSTSLQNHTVLDKYHTPNINKSKPDAPIRITIKIESPPLTLFGPPNECSGGLFSGALVLDVLPPSQSTSSSQNSQQKQKQKQKHMEESRSLEVLKSTMSISTLTPEQLTQDYVQIRKVEIALIQIVQYGKPFTTNSNTLCNCANCRTKITELARWEVLERPTGFAKGTNHGYPFSHLIPGGLPPTSILSNSTTSIKYELVCIVDYIDKYDKKDTINLALPIMIRRSILRGPDRNSLRVFPPTSVTSTAVIPNVAYPKATFPVEIRMDNVSNADRRWRMRKLNWRIEESCKVMIHHCDDHKVKFDNTVALLKKSQKGRKVAKNSNGANNPSTNYFFDSNIRGQTQQSQQEQRQNMITIPTETNEFTGEQQLPADLSTFASNWSVGVAEQRSHQAQAQAPVQQQQSNAASLLPQPSSQSIEPISSSVDEIVLQDTSDTPKDFFIEEIRTICAGDLKSGWKSDFSGKGRIETVAEISIMSLVTTGLNTNMNNLTLISSLNCNSPIFDTDSEQNETNCSIDIEDNELGIYVNHNLIVEVVVAEELVQATQNHAQLRKPVQTRSVVSGPHQTIISPLHQSLTTSSSSATQQHNVASPPAAPLRHQSNSTTGTVNSPPPGHTDGGTGPDHVNGNKSDPNNHTVGIPTGVARVLRMQFKLVITERSGLGVAWDDEVPPTYLSVGAFSPPTYAVATSGANTPDLLASSRSVVHLDENGAAMDPAVPLSNELDQVVLTEPTIPPAARVHESRHNSDSR